MKSTNYKRKNLQNFKIRWKICKIYCPRMKRPTIIIRLNIIFSNNNIKDWYINNNKWIKWYKFKMGLMVLCHQIKWIITHNSFRFSSRCRNSNINRHRCSFLNKTFKMQGSCKPTTTLTITITERSHNFKILISIHRPTTKTFTNHEWTFHSQLLFRKK